MFSRGTVIISLTLQTHEKEKLTFIQGATGLLLAPYADCKPTGNFNLKPLNFSAIALVSNNEAFRFLSIKRVSQNASVKRCVPAKHSGHKASLQTPASADALRRC